MKVTMEVLAMNIAEMELVIMVKTVILVLKIVELAPAGIGCPGVSVSFLI
jgi:hypothetical protein